MTLVATSNPVVSDVIKLEDGLEYNYMRKMATLNIAAGAKIGQVYKSDGDGTYSIVAGADVGYKLTPTVANSAAYSVSVKVGSISKVYSITSDGSATATEIVDALAAAIEADTDVEDFVAAANVSDVLVVTVTGNAVVEVAPVSANLSMVDALADVAILVDDKVYTDTTTGDRSVAVFVGGPSASAKGVVIKEGLLFSGSMTAAQLNGVYRALEKQGIKVGSGY